MGNGRKRGMADLADRTARKTDEALSEVEAGMLRATSVDWAALRPKLGDDETFDRLLAAVREASDRNESLAQLQGRVQALGARTVALARRVCALIA